jgi:GxxExxY protein
MDLLYKEEVYTIVGTAMEVYNQLGPGFLESVYQEAFAIEMRTRKIPFQAQHAVQIAYKEYLLQQYYIPDFIAYDKIIIEIKAIRQLTSVEEAQIINYLKATRMALGVLINFGHPYKLDWTRKIISANIRE